MQPPYGTLPPGMVQSQHHPSGGYVPPYPPTVSDPVASPDQGLRALVALIVFLAVALAIVILLLVIRK